MKLGARVVLGVGVGGTEGEFTLLGASFRDRGKRARIFSQSAGHYTDQLAALAALASGEDR